jgi:hypothetical protein
MDDRHTVISAQEKRCYIFCRRTFHPLIPSSPLKKKFDTFQFQWLAKENTQLTVNYSQHFKLCTQKKTEEKNGEKKVQMQNESDN